GAHRKFVGLAFPVLWRTGGGWLAGNPSSDGGTWAQCLENRRARRWHESVTVCGGQSRRRKAAANQYYRGHRVSWRPPEFGVACHSLLGHAYQWAATSSGYDSSNQRG